MDQLWKLIDGNKVYGVLVGVAALIAADKFHLLSPETVDATYKALGVALLAAFRSAMKKLEGGAT